MTSRCDSVTVDCSLLHSATHSYRAAHTLFIIIISTSFGYFARTRVLVNGAGNEAIYVSTTKSVRIHARCHYIYTFCAYVNGM